MDKNMFHYLINWRRNLFLLMLFLLFLNGFSAHSKHLYYSWWFEQQHLSDKGFQLTTQKRVIINSACRNPFHFSFRRLSFHTQKNLIMPILYCLLLIIGWLWITVFRYILTRQVMNTECRNFCFVKYKYLKIKGKIFNLGIGAALHSDSEPITVNSFSGRFRDHQIKKSIGVSQLSITAANVKQCRASVTKTVSFAHHCSFENEMKKFYNSLSEKDKRRYAGIEAMKLGRGGIISVSKMLKCSRKTVSKGIRELKNLPSNIGYQKRIRRTGGGRKNYQQTYPHIDDFFLDVVKNYTAGDPMKEGMLWTNLSYERIADEISKKHGISVSTKVIRQLIKKHKFGRRKLKKKSTMKQVKNRNEQFENIALYKAEYQGKGNPVISMDSKKKEEIGNFYRSGSVYSQTEIPVYDHDFTSFSKGKVIPHGIYDIVKNKGWINIGISKDTSEFACDSLKEWWYNCGIHNYPEASSLLILCDGGGSNSSRHYIFKEDLQKLANEIQIEIRIAHYPPYTSKYNPIEHRMFPHVTRACRGTVFSSVEYVKELMEKTETKQGLDVTVKVIDKIYETGRKVKENFKENMTIVFDEYLSNWNYRAIPNGKVI